MAELAEELLRGEDAWVVGGAVRDELLGRPVLDLDIACREPERAARAYGARSGGAVFPLSVHHGGWRVALDEGRTVDFLPLQGGSIEADLGTRDFIITGIMSGQGQSGAGKAWAAAGVRRRRGAGWQTGQK